MADPQVNYAGQTIVCNDLIMGIQSPGGDHQIGNPVASMSTVKLKIVGVNFNSAATDNIMTFTLPPAIARYAVSSVWINNASHTLVTATISVRTGAGATGATIAADQAITVSATATDTNNNCQSLTLTNAATMAYNDKTLYVRIGTAEGAAATADVIVVLQLLS